MVKNVSLKSSEAEHTSDDGSGLDVVHGWLTSGVGYIDDVAMGMSAHEGMPVGVE